MTDVDQMLANEFDASPTLRMPDVPTGEIRMPSRAPPSREDPIEARLRSLKAEFDTLWRKDKTPRETERFVYVMGEIKRLLPLYENSKFNARLQNLGVEGRLGGRRTTRRRHRTTRRRTRKHRRHNRTTRRRKHSKK